MQGLQYAYMPANGEAMKLGMNKANTTYIKHN